MSASSGRRYTYSNGRNNAHRQPTNIQNKMKLTPCHPDSPIAEHCNLISSNPSNQSDLYLMLHPNGSKAAFVVVWGDGENQFGAFPISHAIRAILVAAQAESEAKETKLPAIVRMAGLSLAATVDADQMSDEMRAETLASLPIISKVCEVFSKAVAATEGSQLPGSFAA